METMNYTRSRTLTPDLASGETYVYRVYHDPVSGNWETEIVAGRIFPSHPTQDNYKLQTMFDSKSKGRWTYNDCTNVSLNGRYNGIGGSGGSIAIHDGPSREGYFMIAVPSAWLIVYSDIYRSTLAQTALNPVLVHAYAPTETLDYISPERVSTLEHIFEDQSIPRELNISMDPLDTDFSIWFLIVDVVQLKGLWKGLIASKVQDLRSLASADELTAKQLADDHLAVSFGLLPFFDDIKKFLLIIQKWTEIYDKFEKDAVRKRYWRKRPPNDLSRFCTVNTFHGVTPVPFEGTTSEVRLDCSIRISRALHHSTASFSYLCPEFHGFLARLKQFVDAFGIIDPAALWDVIPFTFIVDWFFGIGSWLHKNRPRAFPCDVVIHDYCESVNLKMSHLWYGSYWATNQHTADPVYLEHQYLGTEDHTCYLRRRFRPPAEVVSLPRVNTEIISIRRALISASLIAQRLPR